MNYLASLQEWLMEAVSKPFSDKTSRASTNLLLINSDKRGLCKNHWFVDGTK